MDLVNIKRITKNKLKLKINKQPTKNNINVLYYV